MSGYHIHTVLVLDLPHCIFQTNSVCVGNNGGGRFAFTYTVSLIQKLENVISLFAGVQEKIKRLKK